MSVCLSIYMSVCLKLKISVSTEPIGFYSSEIKPVGPVIVLSYFRRGWDTNDSPPLPKKKDNSPIFFPFKKNLKHKNIGLLKTTSPPFKCP